MLLQFNPHARQELEDATVYYDSIDPALGDYFASEVERVLSVILRFPEAFPQIATSVRRGRLRRFPYGIVYRPGESGVEIIALAHLARKPRYWTER